MKNFLYHARELNAEAPVCRICDVFRVYIFKRSPSNHEVGFIEKARRLGSQRLLCWRRKGVVMKTVIRMWNVAQNHKGI